MKTLTMKNLIFTLTFLLFWTGLNAQTTETITISAGPLWEDAHIRDSYHTPAHRDTNFGTYTRFNLYYWTWSGKKVYFRSLFKFDATQIPTNAVVTSAILYVYTDPSWGTAYSGANVNSSLSGSNDFYLEKITQAWNVSAVTWNNQPATTTSGRVWVPQSNGYFDPDRQIDITTLVQGFVSDPSNNHGLMMKLATPLHYRSRNYASEDYTDPAFHPKVVITYEVPNPPPAAPIVQSVSNITTNTFQVSWSTVPNADNYRLDVSTNASFSSMVTGYNNLFVNGSSHPVGGLTPGTTYYIRMRAENSGGISPDSGIEPAITIPQSPTILAPNNITTTSFNAQWNATPGADQYKLFVANDAIFSSILPSYNGKVIIGTEDLVSGLSGNSIYYYRVKAVNSSGESANSNSQSVLTKPVSPVASQASNIQNAQFTANWTSVPGGDEYWLEVSAVSDFSSYVTGYGDISVGPATQAIVTGLSQGTTYYYRVKASNASGSSTTSNEISVTTILGVVPDDVEYLALKALYDATDGPNWTQSTNWNPNLDPATVTSSDFQSFDGVTVTSGDITRIDRNNKNLNGSLPAELGSLTQLDYLNLGSNNLTGPIPSEFSDLVNLRSLLLRSANLSGSIPVSLGSLVSLGGFDIAYNNISGSIPDEIGNLTQLVNFDVTENNLSGPIPESFSNLTLLDRLQIERNSISGLPTQMGNMTALRIANLNDNPLGSIPTSIGNLNNLSTLGIARTQISDIPVEINNIGSLQSLWIDENQLDFSGLEKLYSSPGTIVLNPLTWAVLPQDKTDTEQHHMGMEGENLVMTTTTGGNYNNYKWNNSADQQVYSNTNPNYTIFNLEPADADSYYVKVYNGYVNLDRFNGSSGNAFIETHPKHVSVLSGNTEIYSGQTANMTVSTSGTVEWYNVPTGGTPIATGTSFGTSTPGTYYVQSTINSVTSNRLAFNIEIALPETPMITSITGLTYDQFTINWDPALGADGYYVDVARDGLFTDFVPTYQGYDESTTSLSITGLVAGTEYHYRVRSYNVAGSSADTPAQSIITPLPIPVILSATNIGLDEFQAHWQVVPEATEYRLDVATDLGFSNRLTDYLDKPIIGTNDIVTGLNQSTDYHYRVRAYNGLVYSDYSETITVTTDYQASWQFGTNLIYTNESDSVGIGTSNPDEALTVNGKVHAEEVLVELLVPGPDYVFESDYDLMDLSELKDFLEKYSHLPNVKKGTEMEEEGIQAGEMTMTLLRKIEELTLYILEQEMKIKDLEHEGSVLNDQITKIKTR